MAAMNDAVALGLVDVLDGKVVTYCPHSKTLTSFSTAVCKSSSVHLVWSLSLARFLRTGGGSFPRMIGTSSVLYDSLDTPSDSRPLMWFSVVS